MKTSLSYTVNLIENTNCRSVPSFSAIVTVGPQLPQNLESPLSEKLQLVQVLNSCDVRLDLTPHSEQDSPETAIPTIYLLLGQRT